MAYKSEEHRKRTQRDYYEKNKEKINKRKKEYYESHKEQHLISSMKYYYNNHREIRDRIKERNKTPKYRFYSLRASAKQRGLFVEINLEEFKKITENICFYCGGLNVGFGVDRVDSSIGYLKSNCVSCCWKCNFMKLDMKKEEFLEQVEKIYKYNQ